MEKRHEFPTEEELLQRLDVLMDQEPLDQEALHTLLDQLDRQTGGSPPDLQAGWRDLQRRHTRRRRQQRPRWTRPLGVAVLLMALAVVLSGTVLTVSPTARAAVSAYLGQETVEGRFPTVTLQLGDEGGGFYTSEHFSCVAENGAVLHVGFRNEGEAACYMNLTKVGLFGRYRIVAGPVLVEPNTEEMLTYASPGNDTYCIRLTSDSALAGTLRAWQGS